MRENWLPVDGEGPIPVLFDLVRCQIDKGFRECAVGTAVRWRACVFAWAAVELFDVCPAIRSRIPHLTQVTDSEASTQTVKRRCAVAARMHGDAESMQTLVAKSSRPPQGRLVNRQMRFTSHGDMIWAGFQGHLHDGTGDEWANGARTVCVRHRLVRVPRHSSGDWGVAQDADARI